MTDKSKTTYGWIAIAITLLFSIYNVVYSAAVIDTKVKLNIKADEKQAEQIKNNEWRINGHDQTVKTAERLEKDFSEFRKEYKVDKKEQQAVNTKILLALERLNGEKK